MVLMGGKSDEHDVSLASGKQVVSNLNPKKYESIPIIIDKNTGQWQLRNTSFIKRLNTKIDKKAKKTSTSSLISGSIFQYPNLKKKPDVIFLALHGKYGEDGRIQGFLDFIGIPYTGCGCLSSAIGMDKIIFKKIIERDGLPTAKWSIYNEKITIKYPCVVKPSDSGSSVGISIIKKKDELTKAVKLAQKYSDRIIVEEYLKGTEVSCAVLGNKKPIALPVIEIIPKNKFFDYEAKYTDGKSEEICPARLPSATTKKVQETAVKVFQSIGARGFARVDMIIKNDVPYILEINTLPGLTPNSLLPKEAKAAGISYPKLLDKIIELSLK